MAKQQKLTYTFYVGGVQVEKLTPEQTKRMAERIGETMSLYYSARPEEYKRFKSKEG